MREAHELTGASTREYNPELEVKIGDLEDDVKSIASDIAEIKGFIKGTLHGRFKDRDVWARFNQVVAKSKGYELPSKY